MTISQALENAVQHHRAGRLPQAEQLYQQILSGQPDNCDALHYLGILAHQIGNFPLAEELFRKAIAQNSTVASYHHNFGNLLYAWGKLDDALVAFQTASELNPSLVEAHLLVGNIRLGQGQPELAIASFEKAVELQPQSAQNHFSLGLARQQNGKTQTAIAAIAAYRQAIALQPQHAAAHQNLCDLLRQQGNLDEAIIMGRQSVRLQPANAAAHYNLAGALHGKGNLPDAASVLRKATELDPTFADAWNQLGCVLKDQDQLAEAEQAFRQAIALAPEHAEAHSNLGATLMPSNLAAAIAAGRTALHLQPENPGIRLTLAFALLLHGDLHEAWPLHEARFDAPGSGSKPRSFTQPKWDGQPLQGRRLLLHAEQGFGDSLQFIRYLPQLVMQGGEIVLECPAALMGLFSTLEGISEIVADGSPLPAFDCHLPMLSLPFIFQTDLASIPVNIPYLTPDAVLSEVWKEKIRRRHDSSGQKHKVGLVWAGSTGHKGDRFRSLELAALLPLFDLGNVDFYSLQIGPAASQIKDLPVEARLIDLTPDLHTFADTAALVAQLDLVISVDTAVVHLAGALGCPVWALLPFAPDWRWMRERTDSPWYPAMRLFRQPSLGEWASVVRELREELAKL